MVCARKYSFRVTRPSAESVDGHPPALFEASNSREKYVACLAGDRKKQASAQPEVPGSTSRGYWQRDNAWHVRPHTAVGVQQRGAHAAAAWLENNAGRAAGRLTKRRGWVTSGPWQICARRSGDTAPRVSSQSSIQRSAPASTICVYSEKRSCDSRPKPRFRQPRFILLF